MTIGCNCEEGRKAFQTYKGFYVHKQGKPKKVFMSGDPVQDFQDACQYANKLSEKTGDFCMLSSSVDHFVSDCGKRYDWYTTADGQEFFARQKDVEKIRQEQKIEFYRRFNAVQSLLKSVGVPETRLERDTDSIMEHCSTETVLALVAHALK